MINDTLSSLYDKSRRNSVDFLRYALAAMVVLSHSFRLGGFGAEPLSASSGETLGTLAVHCFFVLSGFLIARSYATSESLLRFVWQRALRIFPAYWVCLVVIAVGFGPLLKWLTVQPHAIGGYWWSLPSPFGYIANNFFLRVNQPGIDGVLRGTPLPTHLDGALWSLEHEFRCYLAIAALGVLGLFTVRRRLGLAVVMAVFAALYVGLNVPGLLERAALYYNNAITIRLALWFSAGTAFYVISDRVPIRWWMFLPALVLTVASLATKHQLLVGPFALSYVLFYLALRLPLTWWDKRGDFSYGLYIYAFPVQQLLATIAWRKNVCLYFAAAMLGSTSLAVLSWYCIEKPFLRLRHLGAKRDVRDGRPV